MTTLYSVLGTWDRVPSEQLADELHRRSCNATQDSVVEGLIFVAGRLPWLVTSGADLKRALDEALLMRPDNEIEIVSQSVAAFIGTRVESDKIGGVIQAGHH